MSCRCEMHCILQDGCGKVSMPRPGQKPLWQDHEHSPVGSVPARCMKMVMGLIKELLKLPYGSAQKGERPPELTENEVPAMAGDYGPAFGCYQNLMVGRKVEVSTQHGKLVGVVRSEVFLDPTAGLAPTVTVQWPHATEDCELKQLVLLPEFVEDENLVPKKVLQLQRNNWAFPDDLCARNRALTGRGQGAAGTSRQQLQLPSAPGYKPLSPAGQPGLQPLRQPGQQQTDGFFVSSPLHGSRIPAPGGPSTSAQPGDGDLRMPKRDLLSPIRHGLSQPGRNQLAAGAAAAAAAAALAADLQQQQPSGADDEEDASMLADGDGNAAQAADGTPGGEALREAAGVLQMLKTHHVGNKTAKQGKGAAQAGKKRLAAALGDEEARPTRLQKSSAGAAAAGRNGKQAAAARPSQAPANAVAGRTRGAAGAAPPRTAVRAAKAKRGLKAPRTAPARGRAAKQEEEEDGAEEGEEPVTVDLITSGEDEEASPSSMSVDDSEEQSEEYEELSEEEEGEGDGEGEDKGEEQRKAARKRRRRSLPKLQPVGRQRQQGRGGRGAAGPSKQAAKGQPAGAVAVKADATEPTHSRGSHRPPPGSALKTTVGQELVQEEEGRGEEESEERGSGDEAAEFMTADEGLVLDQQEEAPNYEDDNMWVKGWTGRYYPLTLAAKPDDRPVGSTEESLDDGQEYSYEAFVDYWTDDQGNDWVLLKWKGWALDTGDADEKGKLDPRNKGHWERVSEALTGPQRKQYIRWKAGETMPQWLKLQMQDTD